jgi:hypothetical protein
VYFPQKLELDWLDPCNMGLYDESEAHSGALLMKKNRPRKRTLMFERLETKSAPAALLVVLAPVDDATHERVESAVQNDQELLSAVDTSSNWQFQHSITTLLKFVEDNTVEQIQHTSTYSAPTWEQCRTADDMMQLKDADLRTLVMSETLQPASGHWPTNWVG